MERQKREAAQKVSDYRAYHLSGDLSEHVAGQVAQGIQQFDSPQRGESDSGSRSRGVHAANLGVSPVNYLLGQASPVLRIGTTNKGTIDVSPVHRNGAKQDKQLGGVNAISIAGDKTLSRSPVHVTSQTSENRGVPSHTKHTHDSAHDDSSQGAIAPNNPHDSTFNPQRVEQQSLQPANRANRQKMAEDLRLELEKQKAATQALQDEVAKTELMNELENEKQQQQAWQATLDKLRKARTERDRKHADKLAELQAVITECPDEGNPQLEWIQKKLLELKGAQVAVEEENKRKEQEAEKAKQTLQDILQQHEELKAKANQVVKESGVITPEIQALLSASRVTETTPDPSSTLLEQLKLALNTKNTSPSGDWQKDVLRQFLTSSNKTSTAGGAATLKPDILKRLTNEQDEFSMADWLATLNREEAGEWACDDTDECKHKKVKSGMLDRATANIVHKEIWPQKNLLEDWADEDIEFKQLQFEHLVAGEARTIETCTEPAQILGRLRLLRRMAYAKLRGYDWPVIRKMYAAILRSIEAKEYSWSDNFDRFESILYRRSQYSGSTRIRAPDKEPQKKWFCRDWNKQEGCTKQAPHKAWFGTGPNAVARTVVHICAACYMKDRSARDHPETHESCPHKSA